MKLASVRYDSLSEKWYTIEYLPDTPISIILYTEEGGSAEGYYDINKDVWIQYRWSCKVRPKCWREMPRYESSISL